ncbi:PhoH family protein [Mesoaciditoga lauensis]|uniref:PhoH family protein n=1 Tax=Mesoaciditoga lauensis TaxID=1495039 RepID=UPI000A61EF7F|nr:PhoH family protein [Mesoaciditoga lauensis]
MLETISRFKIPASVDLVAFVGEYDANLKAIRKYFNVNIKLSDNEVWLKGEEDLVKRVNGVLNMMTERVLKEGTVDVRDLFDVKERVTHNIKIEGVGVFPKTAGQKRYIEAMQKNDLVFAIGPAGTGKTYLAVAMAVEALRRGEVQRIVLVRPAVEAGEKLGFLPGDMLEKVDPYLRPLYDSLFDMMSPERFNYYRSKSIIEVAPLAYMRGRTLNSAFIILDEAQNTTRGQLKMFLTRMGFGSKAVITGDITQIDLENREDSGLVESTKILKGIKGVEFVYLNKEDVVRNPLVKKIIKAYEDFESEKDRV